MAIGPVSDELRRAGAAMLARLDDIGLFPQGVLWLHWHELNDWRFTVISDLVEVLGRAKIYALLDEALEKVGPTEGLTIFDVHLASSTEMLSWMLSSFAPPVSVDCSFQDCWFEGRQIDAYVYRSDFPRDRRQIEAAARKFQREVRLLAAV